jgi:hypothetical protein
MAHVNVLGRATPGRSGRVPMRNAIGSRYSPFLPCVRLLRCKEVEDENDNYKDENDWGSGGRN